MSTTRSSVDTFLDDPTKSSKITIDNNLVEPIGKYKWLATLTVDYLLQRFCVEEIVGTSSTLTVHPSSFMLNNIDELLKVLKKNNKSSEDLKKRYSNYRLKRFTILGIVYYSAHFVTIKIDIEPGYKNIFDNVAVYDSNSHKPTRQETKSSDQVLKHSAAGKILIKLQNFLLAVVYANDLEISTNLKTNPELILKKALYKDCPKQENSDDCSLFSLVTLLHLAKNNKINNDTYTQGKITEFRFALYHLFKANELTPPTKSELSCNVIKYFFPELKRTEDRSFPTDMHYCKVKYLHLHNKLGGSVLEHMTPTKKTTTTSKPTTLKKRKNIESEVFSPNTKKVKMMIEIPSTTSKKSMPSTAVSKKGKKISTLEKRTSPRLTAIKEKNEINEINEINEVNDNNININNTIIENNEAKRNYESPIPINLENIFEMIEPYDDEAFNNYFIFERPSFSDMQAVKAKIAEYEQESHSRLVIKKSGRGNYAVYECGLHNNCYFQAVFGPVGKDHTIYCKKAKVGHSGSMKNIKSYRTGRKPKQRLQIVVEDAVNKIKEVKHAIPTPKDLQKAVAINNKMAITYQSSVHALKTIKTKQSLEDETSFQYIIPYLKKFENLNPESNIDYERITVNNDDNTETHHIRRLFVCPYFMNNAIVCSRPVISLDACHLSGKWKGTLLLAVIKTPLDELFPIAFCITADNEDLDSWLYFLQNLKKACPAITLDHYRKRCEENYKLFSFVSDRDKGLENALKQVFPNNHRIFCAVHIQRNVYQKFNRDISSKITKLSRLFSIPRVDQLFNEIGDISKNAEKYIKDINPIHWRSSEWIIDESLPPRFGIYTTNNSESLNNMFLNERKGTWLNIMDGILVKMVKRIWEFRCKTLKATGIIPKIQSHIKTNYEYANSCTWMQYGEKEFGEKEHYFRITRNLAGEGDVGISHNLDVKKKTCTCGKWQDNEFPCVDALVYLRQYCDQSFKQILNFHVSKYYTYENQNAMVVYNCIVPIIDTLKSDEETKPPLIGKRQPGRPKEARLKPKSKFAHTNSTNKCSKCGQVGHNSATCVVVVNSAVDSDDADDATILLSNLDTQTLAEDSPTQQTQATNLLSNLDDETPLEDIVEPSQLFDIEEPTYEDFQKIFKA